MLEPKPREVDDENHLGSLMILLLYGSLNAADKITIGVPELNAQFLPLAVGEKRRFFTNRSRDGRGYLRWRRTYGEDLTLPEGGLRLLIDEAKKNAKLNREVTIDQVADLSILKEAQRELGSNKFPIFDPKQDSKW